MKPSLERRKSVAPKFPGIDLTSSGAFTDPQNKFQIELQIQAA